MKTYPFRTNSVSFIVFLLELTLIIKYYLPRKVYRQLTLETFAQKKHGQRKKIFSNSLNLILICGFLTGFFIETRRTIKDFHHDADLDPAMKELIQYVKNNTPGSSVFIFPDSDRPLSFIRRAERERFVVTKFTPTKSTAIYEWYKRAMIKERLRRDINLIDSVSTAYQIEYMITDSAYNHPLLEIEKQFGSHYLFRIKKNN